MAGKKISELAKIHIAKTQLGMDDDTYRSTLAMIIAKDAAKYQTALGKTKQFEGVISAKYLTAAGRSAVLEHLKSVGFKTSKQRKGRPHNAGTSAGNAKLLGKIEALLADAGRPWAYAAGMAKHMYKKDALAFCDGQELAGIIAALVKDAKKRGAKQ